MEALLTTTASAIALSLAGIFFMAGLLTGAWKYAHIHASPEAVAPYYVNIAHRAALLYSFAALLLAVFAFYSPFPSTLNVIAVILPLFFFGFAIVHYIRLGHKGETDNHFRDSENPSGDLTLMWALMIAEIGGFSVLLAGFFVRLVQLA